MQRERWEEKGTAFKTDEIERKTDRYFSRYTISSLSRIVYLTNISLYISISAILIYCRAHATAG